MLLGSWRKDGLSDEYSVHVKSVWLPCDCRLTAVWLPCGFAEWRSYDGECTFQETARDERCCRVPSARCQSYASEQYGRWSCVEGCYERVLSGGDDRRAVHQGYAGWHDGNVHVSTEQYGLG